MKKSTILVIALLVLVVLCGGAYWHWKTLHPTQTGLTVTEQDRQESMQLYQDRVDYIANINAHITDLNNHVATLKGMRPVIAASQQADFDKRLIEFQGEITQLSTDFAAFQKTPLEQFMDARIAINNEVNKIGDDFVNIIKDFKIAWPDGE